MVQIEGVMSAIMVAIGGKSDMAKMGQNNADDVVDGGRSSGSGLR